MSRATNAPASRARRKRILKLAKGFYGASSKRIRTAMDAVDHGLAHGYRGRKQKKRQYRSLWTVRINAAVRQQGLNYSQFVNGLKKAGVNLNRKVLSNMAIEDASSFSQLVETSKKALVAAKVALKK